MGDRRSGRQGVGVRLRSGRRRRSARSGPWSRKPAHPRASGRPLRSRFPHRRFRARRPTSAPAPNGAYAVCPENATKSALSPGARSRGAGPAGRRPPRPGRRRRARDARRRPRAPHRGVPASKPGLHAGTRDLLRGSTTSRRAVTTSCARLCRRTGRHGEPGVGGLRTAVVATMSRRRTVARALVRVLGWSSWPGSREQTLRSRARSPRTCTSWARGDERRPWCTSCAPGCHGC